MSVQLYTPFSFGRFRLAFKLIHERKSSMYCYVRIVDISVNKTPTDRYSRKSELCLIVSMIIFYENNHCF